MKNKMNENKILMCGNKNKNENQNSLVLPSLDLKSRFGLSRLLPAIEIGRFSGGVSTKSVLGS